MERKSKTKSVKITSLMKTDKKILVIGDSCKDVFVYCKGVKLAPDFPVPVVSIVGTVENPGMALNVCENLKVFARNVSIVTNENWQEVTKVRYVDEASNHHFFRIDSGCPNKFNMNVTLPLREYDAIAISDYNKGFLSESQIEEISKNHPLVFLDTKKPLGAWASHVAFIKINEFEFNSSSPEHTFRLREKIIQTLGSRGCQFQGSVYETPKAEVRDSSGAGDSFFASLILSFLQTNSMETALGVANAYASKVVTHRGVTKIEEL